MRSATFSKSIAELTETESESIFAETYGDLLQAAFRSTERFPEIMEGVELTQVHERDATKRISQLIIANEEIHAAQRAAYYYQINGFDSHKGEMSTDLLDEINAGLEALVGELKAKGLWEKVTIVSLSEFGRTITSNGRGTDHGWGGNHFVLGGGVKGGQIFGTYPASLAALTSNGENRGIVLPTLGWESLWHAVAQWMYAGTQWIPPVHQLLRLS